MKFLSRSTGYIGIDLGSSAVKLCRSSASARSGGSSMRRVLRRALTDAPQDAAGFASAWQSRAPGEDLRLGFAGRSAACVLSASSTDLRALRLPEGSEPELRAMVAHEMESQYAEGSGRRAFDFWDSHPPVEGQTQLENVSVLSVLEDEAAAVVRSLEASGLRCEVLDGLPLALARAVALVSPQETEGPVAVLDWGHSNATFSVLCRRRPVFTRYLRDCGFAALPSAVCEALGLSPADAEQLLSTYGLPREERSGDESWEIREILGDIVAEALEALVGELRRTLSYPELHRSQLIPQRIWLVGGGATLGQLDIFLRRHLGLPFEVWRLPAGCGSLGSAVPGQLLAGAVALSAVAWE